ncbi:MAG: nicotinate-nicotinamide nucleotide adenylyltransferase [Victivallales bacterium]|nr:nicotinate-nicotinamide nucleotide adenylyltransferase [Victivallales bacterium]
MPEGFRKSFNRKPRPPRKRDGEFGDRPPRKRDGEFGDRPPRGGGAGRSRAGEWGDRPSRGGFGSMGANDTRREFGDRPPRGSVPDHSRAGEFGDRPMRLRRDREEKNPNEGLSVRRPRLVVFGGSFDPVHRAHIELARRILDQDYGDEVMFMPAKQSPLKKPGQSATAQMRMEMLNLAIADALAEKPKFTLVKKPPRWAPEGTPDEVTEHEYIFSCSDLELTRPGENSYTYDTLCTLRRAFPEKDIFFLMGTDKVDEIPHWHRYAELLQQFDFLIYPRPGCHPTPSFLIAERYGIMVAAKISNAMLPDDPEKFPQMELSSTEVRNALAVGKDVSQYLSPSVLQYIQEHGLYQTEQETPQGEE